MARTVFITGASGGIGAAISSHYTAEGYKVVAPPRSLLDLADSLGTKAYLAECHLDPDVIVHCAAVNPVMALENITPEAWRGTFTVNLEAGLQLIQAFLPCMRARGWGRFVMISSSYSFLARPGRAAYSSSKAALNALVRTAALECASAGILVNAVCPGFVDTELTRKNNSPEAIQSLIERIPLGRLADPKEIARWVFLLGSDLNTYITGQTLILDGGFSIQ